MKTVTVEFLANCADDLAGEVKAIPERRARILVQNGYARPIETADVTPAEHAAQVRPPARAPRAERRG